MRAWQFEDASALLDQASAVLDQRAVVEGAAGAAGLTPPTTLRVAFEDDDGFDDADAEAAAELETVARYRDAVALRPQAVDGVMALGLWGEAPDDSLVRAAEAFAQGDLSAATRAADHAAEVWAGAASLGQGRAISLALLAVAAFVALLLVLFRIRGQRRRRRRSIMQAHLLKQ
jgi:HAMP domain-containing protein